VFFFFFEIANQALYLLFYSYKTDSFFYATANLL